MFQFYHELNAALVTLLDRIDNLEETKPDRFLEAPLSAVFRALFRAVGGDSVVSPKRGGKPPAFRGHAALCLRKAAVRVGTDCVSTLSYLIFCLRRKVNTYQSVTEAGVYLIRQLYYYIYYYLFSSQSSDTNLADIILANKCNQ